MAVTKAQIKATAKYEAKAYDKTLIRLPKGRLDEIRAHIEPTGESLNGFIGRAISETMRRDGMAAERILAETVSTSPQQSAGVTLSPDTLESAQRAARRTGESVAAFVDRAVAAQEKRDENSLKMGINPI